MIGRPHFHGRWLAAIEAWRSGNLPDETLSEAFDPGFAVYANTGLQACIAALEANFPSVARWLGEPWFRPLAGRFARLRPPTDARLILYGETFAEFLRECEADSDWPCLQHLAQLDRMWTQAHVAADAVPLDFARWAAKDPESLGAARLHLAPATHWHGDSTLPVWDLWSIARAADIGRSTVPWRGQAVLITRPGDEVLCCEIDAAGCAFLQACAQGLPLADAAEAALRVAPETDLQVLLSTLFAQGAFVEVEPPPHSMDS
ncbi:HvfC/BufC N-terminal domain-containing protein [Aquabacterium humicola]|uniref:HvfC/BufC N-terminal domain-containing protein n=1 Tax=Aquabacterium humicola TaxID=3237377 RepID=UPI002543A945|nr:DNA-binding domain-containing protein [Rubrivivax pictus]